MIPWAAPLRSSAAGEKSRRFLGPPHRTATAPGTMVPSRAWATDTHFCSGAENHQQFRAHHATRGDLHLSDSGVYWLADCYWLGNGFHSKLAMRPTAPARRGCVARTTARFSRTLTNLASNLGYRKYPDRCVRGRTAASAADQVSANKSQPT